MPVYRYKARTRDGETRQRGEIEAQDPTEAVRMLHARRLIPLDLRLGSRGIMGQFQRKIRLGWSRPPTDQALIQFMRQWGALLGAGVPLRGALTLLVETTGEPRLRDVVRDLKRQIEGGSGVADALARHPTSFSASMVARVRAGEAGGGLEVVLPGLAFDLERARALRRKVMSALLYPALVVVSALAAAALLLAIVVPTFAELYASAGLSLPLPTRMVLRAADGVRAGAGWVGLFGVTIVALGASALRREGVRLRVDAALLRLPLLGPVLGAWAIARMVRVLGALLGAGVGILEALRLASDAAGNRAVQEAGRHAESRVRRGEPLAEGLRESGRFPLMVVHMIQVGEETGGVTHILDGLASMLEDETEGTVARVLVLLEPVMVLGVGILVGGLIVALYLPMLDLVGTLG
jgi:type II secretory pathway component PulF